MATAEGNTTLGERETAFLAAYRRLNAADRTEFDRAFELILSTPDSSLGEGLKAAINAAGSDVRARIDAAIAYLDASAGAS